MSNVLAERKPVDTGIGVQEMPFVTSRMVQNTVIKFLGKRFSAPELIDMHTKEVNLYSVSDTEVMVFAGREYICIATEVNELPGLNIGQRVIVKKDGRYGIVNHQCGMNSYYLVRLDGEIALRGYTGIELKTGDEQ